MNDEELLGYFKLHSRTERALFSREHVARIMMLGGSPTPDTSKWPAFIAVYAHEADIYIGMAHARMRRRGLRVIQGGRQ